MNSILDINEVTRFLINKPDWNINQLYFCLLHIYDEEYCRRKGYTKIERPISLLYALFQKRGKNAFRREDIDYLIKEGYITQIGNQVKIDMIRVTHKFKREFFGEIDFDDFYEIYPNFMDNFNHPSQPDIKLKAGNKESLERIYLSKVKTEAAHQRVMEITQWAVDNNEINVSIEKYINSEMWEQLDEKKNNTFSFQADI